VAISPLAGVAAIVTLDQEGAMRQGAAGAFAASAKPPVNASDGLVFP